MKQAFEISSLIKKEITSQLSLEEQQALNEWLDHSIQNRELYAKLTATNHQRAKLNAYHSIESRKNKRIIEDQLFTGRTQLVSRTFLKYAAAILIPILVIGGLGLRHLNESKITLANIDEKIQPGIQKATLVLSDGNSVVLNKTGIKETIQDAGKNISNNNNQLSYFSKAKKKVKKLVFNELKTARGGGYNLKLADGTKVWLNAGSSLRFPVEFTDSVRQVFVSGEAYFDVTHNGKPFIVTSNDMNIRVLGTQFNVTAYDDEAHITTTLVEGKVQLELLDGDTESIKSVLTPGLQAVINKSNQKLEIKEVKTAQYTSWVDGKLEFNNQNLELVMKKLARWYDFEYSFENKTAKDYHFSARVNADQNISEILDMLQMTTNISFTIEDNTIIIN